MSNRTLRNPKIGGLSPFTTVKTIYSVLYTIVFRVRTIYILVYEFCATGWEVPTGRTCVFSGDFRGFQGRLTKR